MDFTNFFTSYQGSISRRACKRKNLESGVYLMHVHVELFMVHLVVFDIFSYDIGIHHCMRVPIEF